MHTLHRPVIASLCILAAAGSDAGPAPSRPWSWFNGEIGRLDALIATERAALASLPALPLPQALERAGCHSGFARGLDALSHVVVDLGALRAIDLVAVAPAFAPTIGSEPYGFPPRFRIDAASDVDFTDPVTLCDHTDADHRAGRAPITARAEGLEARYIRFTATRRCPIPGDEQRGFFCLGEVFVFSSGVDIAVGRPVRATSAMETLPVWTPRNLTDGISALGLPVAVDGNRFNGWRSLPSKQAWTEKWVQVDLGEELPIDEVRLFPTHAPAFPERTAFGFPLRFRIEACDDAEGRVRRPIFSSGPEDMAPPGDNPVPVPAGGVRARFVRITAEKLWFRTGDHVFSLSEIAIIAQGRNAARGRPVTAIDDAKETYWSRESLTDGRVATGALLDWPTWMEGLAERHGREQRLAAWERQRQVALATAQHRAAWSALAVVVAIVAIAGAALVRVRRARARELAALRERIARDLHDEIGSHLGSIALMSELALRPDAGVDLRESVAEIHRLACEAGTSMRGIIWLVREQGRPTLARLGEAMRQAADLLLRDVPHAVAIPADDGRTADLDCHRHVYLLFREAVHNCARHAQARQVDIALSWDAGRLTLVVADDGCGFDPATAIGGSGLANLRHRATAIGGRLAIASAPGRGTRITLEAPLR